LPEAGAASSWTKFLRGKIEILQPDKGPKFSIDSILLAGFCHIREGETALDIGTGTGIIPAVLKAHFHPAAIAGIEIQPALHACAAATAERNGLDKGDFVLGDARDPDILRGRSFDVAVSNPPFYEKGAGRVSGKEGRELSRHRGELTLEELFKTASRFLKEGGRLNLIIPFADKEKAFGEMQGGGLKPRISRAVKDTAGSVPKRILIQAFKGECLHSGMPPLIVKKDDGSYSDEVKRFLGDLPFLEAPAFFCDAMVGRLAKYLRFAGFDAAYLRDAEDDWLAGECRRSGRTLITRDRPLVARMKKMNLEVIEPLSLIPKEQFAEVLALHPLKRERPRRCLLCNSAVVRLEKSEAEGKVPPYTFRTREDFFICPSCGKLTWGGTHLSRFKREMLQGSPREEK